MKSSLFYILLFLSVFNSHANTIEFLHDKDIEIKLMDAAYPTILEYAPAVNYPTSTIFQLGQAEIHFYLLSYKSKEYYLWVKDLSSSIEIDLSSPDINTSNILLISKSNWLSKKLNADNSELIDLQEIDLYYNQALDSLNGLAQSDAKYRAGNSFNTLVWDSRSAKRLFNFAVEHFNHQFDEKWIHSVPSYIQYWQLMYKLYYQYFHSNAFKELNNQEIKAEIESDFNYPESKTLVFHYFIRSGIALKALKGNLQFLKDNLSVKEKNIAEAAIQKQAVKVETNNQKIDFLFGIDIDGAMEGYFARDSSEKKNVLVFWSTWDSDMITEFNLLTDLKERFNEEYNYIHICMDAYETPEKTKAYIYQNRVGGFHLLPEQSSAFRKSNFRKELKIRDFPFYVLTDNQGKVMETESIPIEISNRLENKLNHFSTKK
ncbi:MAG: TlpA family protein disulfide reductase [Bacteroidota bacterium]